MKTTRTIGFSVATSLLLTLVAFAEEKNTPGTSLTVRVAQAIIKFDYEDIPSQARKMAGMLFRDSLACAAGSHSSEPLRKMVGIVDPSGGDCLILPSGDKGKLLEAVYLNSLVANMLGSDDVHPDLGSPGATIVPVPTENAIRSETRADWLLIAPTRPARRGSPSRHICRLLIRLCHRPHPQLRQPLQRPAAPFA
jgi:hypothetical protein